MKRTELIRAIIWTPIDPEMENMLVIMSAYKSSSKRINSLNLVEYNKLTGEILSYSECLDRFVDSLRPPMEEWPIVRSSIRVMVISRRPDDSEWTVLFDEKTHNIND